MQVILMTETTKKRLENKGFSMLCKFCGKEIVEGELVVRRYRLRRFKPNPSYAHQKCDMERRI